MNDGVLIIAHGSQRSEWVQSIDRMFANKSFSIPYAIGFLEGVPDRSIADGVFALCQRGVDRMHVIPLFVTTGSTHVHEIQYALGVVPALEIDSDIVRISHDAHIVWHEPLFEEGVLAALVRQRVAQLPALGADDAVLLVGHGSDVPVFQQRWEACMHALIRVVRTAYPLCAVSMATLHPANVTERARALAKRRDLTVMPLFICPGYFLSTKIPSMLTHIAHQYCATPFADEPMFVQWLWSKIDSVCAKAAG
ncbi:MAG: hypothetical protein KGO83_00145 [Paenibacillaceae bacterium]|nr:hypothetical protein [Paenibacillaceae bacterium]